MDERTNFIRKFWQERGKIDHPRIATHFREDDSIFYDFELVKRFINSETRILNLCAVTCILDKLLAPLVREIVVVDFVKDFFEKQQLPANVKKIISDINYLELKREFDIVLLFGVLNYFFDEDQLVSIYKKVNNFLSKGGICIIKHQVGIYETVFIDNFSEEIKSHYMAVYRHLELEISLIKKVFTQIEVIDVYPEYLNRWKNTHFYAFIIKKE